MVKNREADGKPRQEAAFGLGPFGRALLRQIVAGPGEHAPLEESLELARVMRGAGVDAVAVAVDRDGGDANRRLCGELRLDSRIGGIARNQPIAVTVGMDHDVDEIGVVERRRACLERRIVKRPSWRPHRPELAAKTAPVALERAAAALVVEEILVPQRRLLRRRGRLHRTGDVLDVVGVAGDEPDHALGMQHGNHAGGATAPVVATEHRARDTEAIHEGEEIGAERRLLAGTQRLFETKPRRPVATQPRHQHPRARLRHDRRGGGIGVHVIGKAVPQDAGPAIGRAIFEVGDIENVGGDCLVLHGARLYRRFPPRRARGGHAAAATMGMLILNAAPRSGRLRAVR